MTAEQKEKALSSVKTACKEIDSIAAYYNEIGKEMPEPLVGVMIVTAMAMVKLNKTLTEQETIN